MSSKIAGDDNFDSGVASRSWVDEKANRASGVTYTNNAPYELQLAVQLLEGGAGSNTIEVDGAIIFADGSSGQSNFFTLNIPSGSTYEVTLSATGAIERWYELA